MSIKREAVVEYPTPRHTDEWVAVIKDADYPDEHVLVVIVRDGPCGAYVTVTVKDAPGPFQRPDSGGAASNATCTLSGEAMDLLGLVVLEARQVCDRIDRRQPSILEAA